LKEETEGLFAVGSMRLLISSTASSSSISALSSGALLFEEEAF